MNRRQSAIILSLLLFMAQLMLLVQPATAQYLSRSAIARPQGATMLRERGMLMFAPPTTRPSVTPSLTPTEIVVTDTPTVAVPTNTPATTSPVVTSTPTLQANAPTNTPTVLPANTSTPSPTSPTSLPGAATSTPTRFATATPTVRSSATSTPVLTGTPIPVNTATPTVLLPHLHLHVTSAGRLSEPNYSAAYGVAYGALTASGDKLSYHYPFADPYT